MPIPLEFFKGDPASGALRSIDDVLGDDVVGGGLVSGLFPGDGFELSSGSSRPVALEVASPMLKLPTVLFDSRSAVDLPIAVDGEITDPEIDAQELLNVSFFGRFYVTGTADVKDALDEHQINLTLAVLEQRPLVVATNVVDLESATERPDRDSVVAHDAKDTVVVGLGGMLTKGPLLAFEDFVGIGNLGNATNSHLGAQVESTSDLVVDELVKIEHFEGLGLPSLSGYPVASLVAGLERCLECGVLFVCGHELDVGYELHSLKYGTKEDCMARKKLPGRRALTIPPRAKAPGLPCGLSL